ncbi:AGAP012069-PA-like protein [Gryllus bimaculatus]|nr:AGAP012069-PA-like protein [Gryllus bimaculatus]
MPQLEFQEAPNGGSATAAVYANRFLSPPDAANLQAIDWLWAWQLSVAGSGGEAGLFRDPDFSTDADALPAGLPDDFKICAWKRPHELSPKPRMFVGGASRSDVVQGALGDCWFLSACAAVAQNQELVKQVIPLGQVLCGEGYSGALTFRFWRLGHWETVRIDDRLPVDGSGQLLYARAAHPDEFWVPLLEKAFAK